MRFGAKHNDIFPILADMIRWTTGLPSRRENKDVDPEMAIDLEKLNIDL
jgi:hypothetical protein